MRLWMVLGILALHGPLASQESILLNPDEQSTPPPAVEYISPNTTTPTVIVPKKHKMRAKIVKAPVARLRQVDRVSMDFREADIQNVLRFISNVAGLNVVTGSNVAGTLSIHLTDVTWLEALNAILQQKNLGYTVSDGIFRVNSFQSDSKTCP